MNIQEMKLAARELGYRNEDLAMYADVCPEVIDALFDDPLTLPPNAATLWFLDLILSPWPYDNSTDSDTNKSLLKESVNYHTVRTPGGFTIHDLERMAETANDDVRLELIDGIIYHLNTPDAIHQIIIGEIFANLREHILKHHGECTPLFAPFGVQLDCDDRTFLQPDILVVCDKEKITRPCLYGTPDLVIEVLSPSTRRKDLTIKVPKYLSSGVKECWMIDPVRKNVLVYTSDKPEIPTIYGFSSKIPVGIWNGGYEIDFNEIFEKVCFLNES